MTLLDDDPRTRTLSRWLLVAALAIPCTWHGAWNLSDAGAVWWATASGLPAALRFVIGSAELAAAVGISLGVLSRPAAAGLALIYAGAVPQHIDQGFSFKHGGYEPPLVYLLIALAFALSPRSATTSTFVRTRSSP